MKRQVELTEDQIKELTSIYKEKIEELEGKINEYRDMIDSLTSPKMRRTNKPNNNATSSKESKFKNKKGYTWKSRSKEILKEADLPLTTNDIYKEMIDRDPKLTGRSRRSLVSSISGALSQADEIESFENPNGVGNLWALPEMLNNDGYPTDKYVDRLNKIKGFSMKYSSEKEDLWS